MINPKMYELGSRRSVIREIFEYGKLRKQEVGEDKVYDFSIGNPSVEAPAAVAERVKELLEVNPSTLVHGYTSAQGDPKARQAIADDLNNRFGTSFTGSNVYLTCGAAASLTISLRSVIDSENQNVMVFAPFFTEYRVFIESMGASIQVVPASFPKLDLNLDAFENMINDKTVAVILNSPNNPTGVVYSEEQIMRLAEILNRKSAEFGHPIYIISDEPYREITYGCVPPFITKYYANSLICYSYSKGLSLPGERIGYILVPDVMPEWQNMYAAVCGAGRSLGFICAPTMFQHVITKCAPLTSDLSKYAANRDLIYNGLTELGYECVRPDGAFYLFVKCLEDDANAFCMRARKYDLLLVPSDDFGCPGYVRIAYCVSADTIKNSMPAFKALAESYK
ncbi:MAG: pyridoxal phosphate-dependent aminotransferase [Ruminobacter sp.]|jgi:aspartate aminotransferase|nr:pyridoxal phosphate-dependent aminotransferase [Ruminobacter sp.]MBR1923665.1 pyridoxal phosphate-dependent aminotransferase [Ruminobacter sp.]